MTNILKFLFTHVDLSSPFKNLFHRSKSILFNVHNKYVIANSVYNAYQSHIVNNQIIACNVFFFTLT